MNKISLLFLKLTKFQKIILGVLVIILLFFILNSRSPKKEQSDTYVLKRGDISEEIIISGNANTSGNASVYSSSTGLVEEVFVKNDDMVEAGDIVLKVKSTASEIERSNALAAYQSAVSTLNTSKQAKQTNQSLLEAARKTVIDTSVGVQQMTDSRNEGRNNPTTNKSYTQDEIDSITSSYTSAKQSFSAIEKKYLDSDSVIAAAQSAVSANWLAYQATLNGVLKAPIGGKIINLSVAPGDSVNAKTSLSTSTDILPVFRIASQDQITMTVKLAEVDVVKVHPGQKALVVFDSLPDKTFDAQVSRVDSVGANTNAVVTYTAYITLNRSDERIRPAMTATVTIKTDEKKDVLLIPNIALKRDNQSITVQVQKDNKIVTKTVTIGMKNIAESEIASGLNEGEVILITKTAK